jgi:hypothetical protein
LQFLDLRMLGAIDPASAVQDARTQPASEQHAAREDDQLEILIEDTDFSLHCTGFDTCRELFCKPSLAYTDTGDDLDADSNAPDTTPDTTLRQPSTKPKQNALRLT